MSTARERESARVDIHIYTGRECVCEREFEIDRERNVDNIYKRYG